MRCGVRLLWLTGLLWAMLAAPAAYGKDGDQVHIGGRAITVGADEAAGDLVCIGCSIRMLGSCGDVVAIGGSVDLNGRTKGDVVVIGGALRLGENASVSGDVVTVGGRLWRDPNSVVRGQISSRSGVLFFIWLVLVPSLPIILLIALVVWLVSRNRQGAPVSA
jgi:hypothetical protein